MDDGFEVLEIGNDYCFRLSREARERTCNLPFLRYFQICRLPILYWYKLTVPEVLKSEALR